MTWDGGAGTFNWNDAANWSTNALPGATDEVAIPDLAGSPTIALSSSTAAIHSLVSDELTNVASGTLMVEIAASLNAGLTLSGIPSGSCNITVSGTLKWTGGEMSGTGQTIVSAGGHSISADQCTHRAARW